MKYLRAIFKDGFLLLAAFFILLPTGFKLLWGMEGQVFVAQPLANDPHFDHTVLYMVSHTIDGATAVILNRPYPLEKKNSIPSFVARRKIPVFWGGPVQDETAIFVLEWQHSQNPKVMSLESMLAQDIDILDKIEKSPDRYRVLIGCARWQALQYEMERISDIWVSGIKNSIIFPVIFSAPALDGRDIWLKVLEDSDFYKGKPIKGKITA